MDPLTTNSSRWLLKGSLPILESGSVSEKMLYLHFMRHKSDLFSGGPWLEPLLGPKAFGSGDNVSHDVGTLKSTSQLLCRLRFSLGLSTFAQESIEVMHFWQEFSGVTLCLLSASY